MIEARAFIDAMILLLALAAAAAGSDISLSKQVIEPAISLSNIQVVYDEANQEHIFAIGASLLHFYRDGDYWDVEEVDGNELSFSELAVVRSRNRFLIFYYRGNDYYAVPTQELRVAEGITHAWRFSPAPNYKSVGGALAACASGENTVWLMVREPAKERVIAFSRRNDVWDETPLKIDDDGDCGGWMSAAGDPNSDQFHLVYQVGYPYYDLRYAHYDGASLHTETIYADGEQGEAPSLAMGGDGRLHLSAWDGARNCLLYGVRTPDGAWSFSSPDETWGVGQGSSLALDADGQPAIAYRDENSAVALVAWNGAEWQREQAAGPSPQPDIVTLHYEGTTPSICTLTTDKTDYNGDHPGRLMQCKKAGDHWSSEAIALSGSGINGVTLMFDAAGQAVFLVGNAETFSIWRPIDGVYRQRRHFPGDPRGSEYMARGAIDSEDRIHVVGASYSGGSSSNFFKLEYWRPDGDGFSRETILDVDVAALDLALDSSGAPHILFAAHDAQGDAVIRYGRRTDDGWQFEELSRGESFGALYRLNVVIRVDRHDQVHVAYPVEDYGIAYGVKTAAGWQTYHVALTSPPFDWQISQVAVTYSPDLAMSIDDYDVPHIAIGGDDLFVFEKTGVVWQMSKIDLYKYDHYLDGYQLALDRRGRPTMLLNIMYSSLSYARLNGLTWELTPLELTYSSYQYLMADFVRSPSGEMVGLSGGGADPLTLFRIEESPPFVDIRLSSKNFTAGDLVKVEYVVENSSQPADYELAVLLEVPDLGLFYSWPGWRSLADGLALTPLHLAADETRTGEILNFTWPEGAGTYYGLAFWAALLDSSLQSFQADTAHIYFSYD